MSLFAPFPVMYLKTILPVTKKIPSTMFTKRHLVLKHITIHTTIIYNDAYLMKKIHSIHLFIIKIIVYYKYFIILLRNCAKRVNMN